MTFGRNLPTAKELFQMTLTFFLAVIGWIIFRAETMTQAVDYLSLMLTNKFYDPSCLQVKSYLCYCLLLMLVEWLQRDKQHALQWKQTILENKRWLQCAVDYIIMFLIVFVGNFQGNQFIYFQF